MLILIVAVYLLIAIYQGRILTKNKQWKEFIVFEILLAIGFMLSSLVLLGIPIPDPIDVIKNFFDNIYAFFD